MSMFACICRGIRDDDVQSYLENHPDLPNLKADWNAVSRDICGEEMVCATCKNDGDALVANILGGIRETSAPSVA